MLKLKPSTIPLDAAGEPRAAATVLAELGERGVAF
jgi:hypothetical protein